MPSWPESQVATDGISRPRSCTSRRAPRRSPRPARPRRERGLGGLERDVVEPASPCTPAPRIPVFCCDFVGRHRRPAEGAVADEVLVRQACSPLTTASASIRGRTAKRSRTPDARQTTPPARAPRRAPRARPRSRRRCTWRMKSMTSPLRGANHHEVVVVELPTAFRLVSRPLPRVLVVEHHGACGAATRARARPRGSRGSPRTTKTG